jgi:hypothetical protein
VRWDLEAVATGDTGALKLRWGEVERERESFGI